MSRTEPDPVFTAAAGEELERRVRAHRGHGSPAARRSPAGRPAAWWRRQEMVNALASVAVLALIAAVTFGLLQLPHPAAENPAGASSDATPAPVAVPCADPHALDPLGCATYRAVAAHDGSTATAWPGSPPASITLRIQNGKVTALIASGCNALTIPVTLSATHLIPHGPAGSTLALCQGARQEQERWITDLFAGPVSYHLTGQTLDLTARGKSLTLVATPLSTSTP